VQTSKSVVVIPSYHRHQRIPLMSHSFASQTTSINTTLKMEYKKQDSAYFSLTRQHSLDGMSTPLKHERYDSDGLSTVFQDSPGSSMGSGRTERSSSTASLGPRHPQQFSGQLANALMNEKEKIVPQEPRNVKKESGKNAVSQMVRRDLIRTYSLPIYICPPLYLNDSLFGKC
jgi:hypothetical protein